MEWGASTERTCAWTESYCLAGTSSDEDSQDLPCFHEDSTSQLLMVAPWAKSLANGLTSEKGCEASVGSGGRQDACVHASFELDRSSGGPNGADKIGMCQHLVVRRRKGFE